MERPLNLKPLTVRDESSVINRKKAVIGGKLKSSKPVAKNGGASFESRKALNDITNKSSVLREASSQKKILQSKKVNVVEDGKLRPNVDEVETTTSKKESSRGDKINIAEERFLHDHSKCVEAQKAAPEIDFWNTVLPGHDSEDLTVKYSSKSNSDTESTSSSLLLEEISMSEFSDNWFDSWWKSPPSSPIQLASSSSSLSLFDWEVELAQLKLKENDFMTYKNLCVD